MAIDGEDDTPVEITLVLKVRLACEYRAGTSHFIELDVAESAGIDTDMLNAVAAFEGHPAMRLHRDFNGNPRAAVPTIGAFEPLRP